MTIQTISAIEVQQKIQQGGILIDIRSVAEYQREHIQQAINIPLEQISQGFSQISQTVIVFHCLSGMRTKHAIAHLENIVGAKQAFIMERGLQGWKEAGFPSVLDKNQPIDLMRQVQMVAGLLVCLGVVLGWTISPIFFALCGLVGIGMLIAGFTGFCGMARLLKKMPWNQ